MKADHPKDIGKIFRDGTLIDKALQDAALESKRLHQRLGLPSVAWRDGKVVWLDPEGIDGDRPGTRRQSGG